MQLFHRVHHRLRTRLRNNVGEKQMKQLKWFTPQNFSGVPALMGRYGYEQTSFIEDASMVVFTGGSDISPRLYGQKLHRTTTPWEERDKLEVDAFHVARSLGIPMFGICRGAQLLCALNGGKLWQNVSHHGVNHMIYDAGLDKMFPTSSCHHQMCRPDLDKTDVLGWAYHQTDIFEDDSTTIEEQGEFGTEPELMYHKNLNALAVQGHPEWMPADSPMVRWIQSFIKEKM